MKKNYKIMGFLLSLVITVTSIPMHVTATEIGDMSVSENAYVSVSENEIEMQEEVEILPQVEGIDSFSDTYINPIYEGLIAPNPEPGTSELRADFVAESVETASVYSTVDKAADYVRKQLVARTTSFSFVISYDLIAGNSYIAYDIIDKALEHTEACSGQEGDALAASFTQIDMSGTGVSGGFQFTFTPSYLSTASQEQELTTAVNAAMQNLSLNGKSEYDKIKAIHDYICDNVNYDHTYTKYSAYDALCTGTAVCQGYAILFYRMCKEAGIPVRIITGLGNTQRHAWNIVKLGDVYYNIDCTWDGQEAETLHTYFLLDEIDFAGHTRDEEYTTDAFHAAYPMAEYSYGKETVTLLNLTNIDATFTTLDETTVTSHANGRPKVLFFFNTGCSISQTTLKSIVDYDFSGVDIIAIDTQQNTKEAVKTFKETYGSDTVTFCYDTGTTNSSYLWSYISAVGLNGDVYYPVVCYIDANDKLQHLTTAISSGAQIHAILKRYCGYKDAEYTITYHLDGGTNHADNPVSFTANTDTITLKDAQKTGYAFKGWYADDDFTVPVTQIVKGTKENIVLYAKFVKELELVLPDKTTYAVGEKIDLTGGSVTHGLSGKTSNLTTAMISGFSSDVEGICTVTVTYQECTTTFDVLIVAEPELRADYGQTLGQVKLPTNQYGVYGWADNSKKMDQVGEQKYQLTFTPQDTEAFSSRTDLEAVVNVYCSISESATIILGEEEFTYNGLEHKPEVSVMLDGKALPAENYSVGYMNNIDAGTATITVTGKNFYEGSTTVTFAIEPAELVITAKDVKIFVGDELPVNPGYEIAGLIRGESLVKEPTIAFTAADSQMPGEYEIIPSGAEATNNYSENITYVNGKLQIAEKKVAYIVTFDVQGIGEAPADITGVNAGSAIFAPEKPFAEGYTFEGWYKDAACTKVWNFETDIVQSDITLYAKWLENKAGSSFSTNTIQPVYYTGKALKPTVQVYDGDTLLKVNKDYKLTYENNTNVNTAPAGDVFNSNLPYVTITGKGNYTDTVSINFDILPAIIGDGSDVPAQGVALKLDEQLVVNSKKAVSPFKSIKLGRSMKAGVDFNVVLTAIEAKDETGNVLAGVMANGQIPAGSSGKFQVVITGIGNYTGSITKTVVVKEKTYLMKNAGITLGKNIKSLDFAYYTDTLNKNLPVGYYDAASKKYYAVVNGKVDYNSVVNVSDIFTVKCGSKYLVYKQDFNISYMNNDKVGTATMVLTGIGNYSGTKTITFKLTGKTFSAKTVNVTGLKNPPYTGCPITQNDVTLTYVDGTVLEYGKHYTIQYAKNINKGTATMTFVAVGDSGYQGKFTKKFTIGAASVKGVTPDASTLDIVVEYDKAGVKPADMVILRNQAGKLLVYGKDYTISYRDNKAVADKTAVKAPTIIIKGKGNYTDTREIPFTITKASLNSEKIAVTLKETAYNAGKASSYQYKPSVKVADGKKTLSVNKDYTVRYENNTQEAYEAYYINGTVSGEEFRPRVIITACESGNYKSDESIILPLPIYRNKLAANKLYVVVAEANYTGKQVAPDIIVYYSSDTKAVAAVKKQGLKDEAAICAQGLVKLQESRDYKVTYGANIVAGNNKGTVKIIGNSPEYGGSVTIKFKISSKKIVW